MHRYEVTLHGELAILTYHQNGNQIAFLHTGVPEALEGHGVASKLASTALEEARARGLKVVAACPFVASYVRHHAEYFSLLTPTEQARLSRG